MERSSFKAVSPPHAEHTAGTRRTCASRPWDGPETEALQKAAKRLAKDGLSQGKRRPIRRRKTAYWRGKRKV